MDDYLLVSDGFLAGSFHVPPFRLRRGDCLQIRLPLGVRCPDIERALTAESMPAGLRCAGRLARIECAMDTRGTLARMFTPELKASAWLARQLGVSIADAYRTLGDFEVLDLASTMPVRRLHWDYRVILSVARAVARNADIVVFDGAPPQTRIRRWLAQEVGGRFAGWAGFYASGPIWSSGAYHRYPPVLPNATVVEAQARPVPLSA